VTGPTAADAEGFAEKVASELEIEIAEPAANSTQQKE
jgi:hypothetical protein